MATPPKESESPLMIREVWAENLEEELQVIRSVVDRFPYVAMDTEFPGVVLRPTGVFRSSSDYNYQTLRLNVNKLKIIQLGLSFTDEHGNLARSTTGESCIWQFNFKEFNPREDPHAPESIDLLRRSGIDLELNEEKGIDSSIFAELFMSSGIVLNEDVQWVTFHSPYDFGYLLKILTHQDLPCEQADFLRLIKVFFPTIYDVKYLMRFCGNLHGGLNRIAEKLKLERFGSCHQAGSDSLLTSRTYMKLKKEFFHGSTEQYAGVLYGLDNIGSHKCNSSNLQCR